MIRTFSRRVNSTFHSSWNLFISCCFFFFFFHSTIMIISWIEKKKLTSKYDWAYYGIKHTRMSSRWINHATGSSCHRLSPWKLRVQPTIPEVLSYLLTQWLDIGIYQRIVWTANPRLLCMCGLEGSMYWCLATSVWSTGGWKSFDIMVKKCNENLIFRIIPWWGPDIRWPPLYWLLLLGGPPPSTWTSRRDLDVAKRHAYNDFESYCWMRYQSSCSPHWKSRC